MSTNPGRIAGKRAAKAPTWHVWSRSGYGESWVAVDQGTEKTMLEAAARKQAAAVKFMDATETLFVALPEGEQP